MTEKSFASGEAYAYPLIIKKLLHTPLIHSPNQQIVYRDSVRYTYKDLSERIHRLASGLTDLGVRPGETVAVFDYDSHRFLECFFAIPMMGAVLQMVNWRLSSDQILYTINHADAQTVLIHADFLPILDDIRGKIERMKRVVVLCEKDQEANLPDKTDQWYEHLLAGASPDFDFPDLDENTKATTFYTTGTTGAPKGVHFTHRQLVLHTLSGAVAVGSYDTIGSFRSSDVYMPMTPMFHVHAWGMPYTATLLGAKQVYPGRYEPEMLLKLIVTEKVTFSHCVPTILQMIAASPMVRHLDLSRLKVVIGGSKLPLGLAKAVKRLGITTYTGYGMSETCPLISISIPKPHMMDWEEDRLLEVVVKTGLPVPLVEFEIVDQDGNPLPHDGASTGEVVFRTPWLTQSYFRDPEKTRELWRNGWLYSGDVGHIDDEGYLSITDRVKDVIKSGGEWISSLDLENILSQHEAVAESAAIGVPDEKWGERPMMIVVLNSRFEGQVTESDLKAFMQEASADGKLPRYGVPDHYRFVDTLPKTSVGKLDKITMRQTFR